MPGPTTSKYETAAQTAEEDKDEDACEQTERRVSERGRLFMWRRDLPTTMPAIAPPTSLLPLDLLLELPEVIFCELAWSAKLITVNSNAAEEDMAETATRRRSSNTIVVHAGP